MSNSVPKLPQGIDRDFVLPKKEDESHHVATRATLRLLTALDALVIQQEWHKLAHAADVLITCLYEQAFRPDTTVASNQVLQISEAQDYAARQARLRRAVFAGVEALIQLAPAEQSAAREQIATFLRRCEPLAKAGIPRSFMRDDINVHRSAATMALRTEQAVLKLHEMRQNPDVTVRDVLDELLDAQSLVSQFPASAAPVRLSVGLAYQHLLLCALRDAAARLGAFEGQGGGGFGTFGSKSTGRKDSRMLRKRRRSFLGDSESEDDHQQPQEADQGAPGGPLRTQSAGTAAKKAFPGNIDGNGNGNEGIQGQLDAFQPFRFNREFWRDNEAESLWEDATAHVQGAIDLDPTCTHAWLQQFQLQLINNNKSAARQLLESATQHVPHDADMHAVRVVLHGTDGRTDSLQEAMHRAEGCLDVLRCDSGAFEAVHELQRLYEQHGVPIETLIEGFLVVFDSMCAEPLHPNEAEMWHLLASSLQKWVAQNADGLDDVSGLRTLLHERYWWADVHFVVGATGKDHHSHFPPHAAGETASLLSAKAVVAAFVLGPQSAFVQHATSALQQCKQAAATESSDAATVARFEQLLHAVQDAVSAAEQMSPAGAVGWLPAAQAQGMSLSTASRSVGARRQSVVVEANGKKSMGCTLEGTRRKRVRVSGFRARMQTAAGRRVLASRRKKGRKVLCPAHKYVKGAPKPRGRR